MASAFGIYELLVETYGEHLANSNRSTPLSESRARNLSSPVFVDLQQYGRREFYDRSRTARFSPTTSLLSWLGLTVRFVYIGGAAYRTYRVSVFPYALVERRRGLLPCQFGYLPFIEAPPTAVDESEVSQIPRIWGIGHTHFRGGAGSRLWRSGPRRVSFL